MPIDPQTAHALEAALAGVPGVLGAVAVDDASDAGPVEVQAFVQADADLDAVGRELRRIAGEVTDRAVTVVPLQLSGAAAATAAGDRPRSEGDRQRGRPRLVSVVLDSSLAAERHEALVALHDTGLAAGRASVGRDPALALVAAACDALAGDGQEPPVPRAVERVTIDGLEVVVVAVTVRGRPLIGSALLEDEPEPAAVVRATLDAVNRWYGLG